MSLRDRVSDDTFRKAVETMLEKLREEERRHRIRMPVHVETRQVFRGDWRFHEWSACVREIDDLEHLLELPDTERLKPEWEPLTPEERVA